MAVTHIYYHGVKSGGGLGALILLGLPLMLIIGIFSKPDPNSTYKPPSEREPAPLTVYQQNEQLLRENRMRFMNDFDASGMEWSEFVRSRGLDHTNPDHMWRYGNYSLPSQSEHH